MPTKVNNTVSLMLKDNMNHNNKDNEPTQRKITAIVIGAGSRGRIYAQYGLLYPDLFEVVAVAEPREYARELMKRKYSLPDEKCFTSWEDILTHSKISDCAIIATQDKQHKEPAVALARLGYHLLLEKPMAVTEEDCREIYNECKKADVILAVCHVLRYHPPAKKLKDLIDSGIIGDVVNINHTEPVGFYHFAHSFVRGNWGNSSRSTFSLLAKCCHDVDLIHHWMNKKCTKLSSFGTLHHFRKEKKPPSAASRCLDCSVERSCPYSAKKLYLSGATGGFVRAVCDIEEPLETYQNRIEEALRVGPYGKCVYDTDNDVCDNQIVMFEFEDGSTASLTMVAFSEHMCTRKVEVYGTLGQLVWDEAKGTHIHHFDFNTQKGQEHSSDLSRAKGGTWSHGGADFFLVEAFVKAVASGDKQYVTSGPSASLETHLLTFAAEHARTTGTVLYPSKDPRWTV